MIIDSHAHVFPDKIAEKSIKLLADMGKQKAAIGGRVSDLINSMKNGGVDISVVLPVLTKPEQFESINRFAAELNKLPEIFSFAGIHPYCENINKSLDCIVNMGFKGVKLHPDYQQTYITDEGYIKILDGCRKRGLKAVIHAGIDPAFPENIHCPPSLASQVIHEFSNGEPFIVLAHLGGIDCIDEVERLLVGLPVYFDLSFILEEINQTRLKDIISAHGYNKVLFATDSPWRDVNKYINIMNTLALDQEIYQAIMGKNCAKFLDI